jgi:hypothetical protein
MDVSFKDDPMRARTKAAAHNLIVVKRNQSSSDSTRSDQIKSRY